MHPQTTIATQQSTLTTSFTPCTPNTTGKSSKLYQHVALIHAVDRKPNPLQQKNKKIKQPQHSPLQSPYTRVYGMRGIPDTSLITSNLKLSNIQNHNTYKMIKINTTSNKSTLTTSKHKHTYKSIHNPNPYPNVASIILVTRNFKTLLQHKNIISDHLPSLSPYTRVYGIKVDSDKTHNTLSRKPLKNHNKTTLRKRNTLPTIKHSYIRKHKVLNKHSNLHSNPPTQNKNTQYFSNTSTIILKACQNKHNDHIIHTNQRKINQRSISKSTTRYQLQLFSLPTHKYGVYSKHKDHLEHTNQRKTKQNYIIINYKNNNNTKNNLKPNTKDFLNHPNTHIKQTKPHTNISRTNRIQHQLKHIDDSTKTHILKSKLVRPYLNTQKKHNTWK